MRKSYRVALISIPGVPLILKRDNLVNVIVRCLKLAKLSLRDGDVLAVASKVISKSEGRLVSLKQVKPSSKARRIASKAKKDPIWGNSSNICINH